MKAFHYYSLKWHHTPQEAVNYSDYESGLGSQIPSVHIFTLSFVSCMSRTRIINLSGIQFPHLEMRGTVIVPTPCGGVRIK